MPHLFDKLSTYDSREELANFFQAELLGLLGFQSYRDIPNSQFEYVVQFLNSEGVGPEDEDEEGYTLLHFAARSGSLEAVHVLLAVGFDIGKQDADGLSAHHHAARSGATELVFDLIDKGLDINATCLMGLTLLHCAVLGDNEVFDYLATDSEDGYVIEPSNLALKLQPMQPSNIGLVNALKGSALNIHATSENGYTALHYAAECGDLAGIHALKAMGLRIYTQTKVSKKNLTAFDLAAIKGHVAAMEMMIELYGYDPLYGHRHDDLFILCYTYNQKMLPFITEKWFKELHQNFKIRQALPYAQQFFNHDEVLGKALVKGVTDIIAEYALSTDRESCDTLIQAILIFYKAVGLQAAKPTQVEVLTRYRSADMASDQQPSARSGDDDHHHTMSVRVLFGGSVNSY